MLHCMLLLLSILPSVKESAERPMWHNFSLDGGISVPTLMNPKYFGKFDGCALVRVKEVSRTVEAYRTEYQGSNLIAKIPSKVKMQWRIEEVFLGDTNLQSRIASATVWERSGKDLYFQPLYTEWIPEESDNGIWLVKLIDGNLTCISLKLLGLRFPVYASGVHKHAARAKDYEFSEVLVFARALKHYTDSLTSPQDAQIILTKHCNSANALISQWATWEMGQRNDIEALKTLKAICLESHRFPIAQAIADDALLSSGVGDAWRNNGGRQSMIARWLTLEGKALGEIVQLYLGPLVKTWDSRGYDHSILKEQVKQAILSRRPGSKEWHFLVRFSQKVDQEFHKAGE